MICHEGNTKPQGNGPSQSHCEGSDTGMQTETGIDTDAEALEPSYTVGGNGNKETNLENSSSSNI